MVNKIKIKKSKSKINKKSLSPLISVILLIVISVILVSIVLGFGQGFTTQGLSDSDKVIKECNQITMFSGSKVDPKGNISFKNISPGNETHTIIGYKILSTSEDSNFNNFIYFEDGERIVTPGSTTIFQIPKFPPEEKFTVLLLTDKGEYISLDNIKNVPEELQDIPGPISSENLILSFIILGEDGTIDSDLNTISLELPYGTNVTALTPTITISESATIDPLSGVSRNFTNPVTYTVTAEDKSVRVYTVTITLAEPPQQYNTGALSPGTMADDATIGSQAWSNPDNSKTSNNVYSSVTMGTQTGPPPTFTAYTTHYLKATNFGFNIPTGATIDGIKVEIEKYTSGPYGSWKLKIVKADGSIGSTNLASGTWPTPADPNTYETYGGASNLWGETWTAENINDSDFGIVISITGYEMWMCLNGDTLISTNNGYKKIKDLNIGENVLSYNDITKKLELKPIINIWYSSISNANNRYFYIYYNNGKIIKATENHRFYINGEYKRADELKVGDLLLSSDLLEYPIENIEIVENTTDMVWDIEVEDNHNFFANDILVHNLSYYAYVDHIRMTVYYTN